ncbi:hypothetical protein C5O00_07980 [Pukyongia salina]|uniref:Uncharacterized protein n=1 Tax=Pukyongia salina TaxID=2094025 RepID=A0A2S0HX32_9FLAO|nr:hypothetical protein [Pukyongia salina]AVI51114.1 hypothetical protein C5O00_07980 [Pukyongia salina]
MKNKQGFVRLKTVGDYWKKMKHDYNRLLQNTHDSYAAFDFFITAHHMTDWYINHKSENKTKIRDTVSQFNTKNDTLIILDQIASNAKHYSATAPKHKSIEHISDDYFEPGYIEDGYIIGPIVIELTNGQKFEAIQLAENVMTFWEEKLTLNNIIKT